MADAWGAPVEATSLPDNATKSVESWARFRKFAGLVMKERMYREVVMEKEVRNVRAIAMKEAAARRAQEASRKDRKRKGVGVVRRSPGTMGQPCKGRRVLPPP